MFIFGFSLQCKNIQQNLIIILSKNILDMLSIWDYNISEKN